jgi:DNA-binding transcriptional LysR family regulator
VTQPALSALIRQIEGRLEMPLFVRTTHSVALSEPGRAILPHVERLLATAEHVFVDMSAALTHERPAIRIGVMPSAMAMVASAVAALDEVVDPPSVQLSDGRSDELLCGLGEGRLDMIVSAAPTSDPDRIGDRAFRWRQHRRTRCRGPSASRSHCVAALSRRSG